MGARVACRVPRRVYVGSAHIREVLEEVVGHVDRVHEVPPGVDVDEFVPAAARRSARGAARGGAAPTRRTPGTRTSACRTTGNAARFAEFFAGDGPTVVYFGKLIHNKGVHVCSRRCAGSTPAR